jgi:hypothetical protein
MKITYNGLTFYEEEADKNPNVLENYKLIDVLGLESNMVTPVTQKSPYQLGATLIGTTVSPRIISLSAVVYDQHDSYFQLKVRALTKQLNGAGSGASLRTLNIVRAEGTELVSYSIQAIPQESPQTVSMDGRNVTGVDIEFFCPNPYFSRQVIGTIEVGGDTGTGYIEPPSEPGYKTVTSDVLSHSGVKHNIAFIDNVTSDFPSPLKIEVAGPISTPIFTKGYAADNGERIKIDRHISASEKLHIDTGIDGKYVYITDLNGNNRVNILGNVDMSVSTFFQMHIGTAPFELISDQTEYESDADYPDFTITYLPLSSSVL